jgi:peptidoglycan/xylan/chitin deacetylase (PgdA/CDA1 family)
MSSVPEWAVRYDQVRPVGQPISRRARSAARRLALSVLGAVTAFEQAPFLRCIYAHNVYDDQVASFRRLIDNLQRHGTFVSAAEVIRIVRGERALDGQYFHLSFDDGFDNLYRNALGVLGDLGVPCTVFVPTRMMGASDDEVLSTWWADDACPTRPLRWEWIEEMARLGHDFGSHTRTHARLAEISENPKRLRDEIAGSKDDLEQRLGVPCRYFAAPWGEIGERGLEAVAAAGYEAAFNTVRDRVVPGRTDLFAVPRHHFEADWPWLHVRFFAAGGLERG